MACCGRDDEVLAIGVLEDLANDVIRCIVLQERVVATFVFTCHVPFVRLAQPRECLEEGSILRRSSKV